MHSSPDSHDLHKIVVLNPKGGCGKTTLATNLASFYALRDSPPTLMDCDPQGFSTRWLDQRPHYRPIIHGVNASEHIARRADMFKLEVSLDSDTVIFDLPGNIGYDKIHAITYNADSVLIPVLPSAIDVYSATRFIAELLLVTQRRRQLAIVANRTRRNTKSFQMLKRFLGSLQIPLIAVLRDSQNYVHAVGHGIGICEMPAYKSATDMEQLKLIIDWLDQRHMRQLDAATSPRFEHIPGAQVLTPVHYKDRKEEKWS
jgi:chromosome partitioning protein